MSVGMLYRRAYRAELFLQAHAVDFLEICSDHYLDQSAEQLEELDALAASFRLLPHGLNLSIGSADGISDDYLARLKALVRRLDPPWFSDHLAFTRYGSREIGHLAPLPRTAEAVEVVVRNIDRVRSAVERPFLLENIAASFELPGSQMRPGQFVREICERSGCGLLLDVTNLLGDAHNLGHDPQTFLNDIDPASVHQVHFAGGHVVDGVMVDSHAYPVEPAVWRLMRDVLERVAGRSPALTLEREERLPPFADIVRELEGARRLEPLPQAV